MYSKMSALAAMAMGSLANIVPLQPIRMGSYPQAMTGHANNGKSHFDPAINRHTGKLHEHRREIARNLRNIPA